MYEGHTNTFNVLESTHLPKDAAYMMDLHSWDIPPSPPSEMVRQRPSYSISTSGASSNQKGAMMSYFANLFNL